MLSEINKLSISWAHFSSRNDLGASCCMPFESPVQEEHNGAILETVSLFCDMLLAKIVTWPDLTPRLDKYTQQRKT